MKLATYFVPKIISRFPGSLKLACVDPTSSKIKHQLCHYNAPLEKAGMRRSIRKKLLESEDGSAQLQSLLAGELSDGGGGRHSGNHRNVPKGFIAVLVGPLLRRFVIPISFFKMPEFMALMEKVADEFGCDYDGAIEIPCEEDHFEQILITCLARHKRMMSSKSGKKLRKMPRNI